MIKLPNNKHKKTYRRKMKRIGTISTKGITVIDDKTGKRIIFREKILALPPPFRFLKHLAVQSYKLPDGSEGQWESVYHEVHTVLVAALTPEKKLILVRLFRFPLHGDCLELPGGNAEEGASLTVTARRELLEETGYSSHQPLIKLGGGPICSGGTNARYTVFAALNCVKLRPKKLDAVEKLAGLRVEITDPAKILHSIAQGDQYCDPQLAHAILALIARGIINCR
jgi:ADP-ribose pyrophosphatase YjhB (NUDIX family)